MNKQRRNDISKCITDLEIARSNLEIILSEEEDAFENMPESLRSSFRGETAEEAIDVLNEAIDNLDDIINSLTEISV